MLEVPSIVSSYLWVAPALVVVYYGSKITYRLLLHPFRKIPGPFLAKITGQWILFTDFAGARAKTIHDLHMKYGEVVQLSPHELSFCSLDSVRAIYEGASECPKGPIYDTFGRTGLFSMQDPVAHKERRRLMSHVFAPANINEMEPIVREHVIKLTQVIDRKVPESIDARQWFRMLSLDVSGGVFLGKPFGGLDSDIASKSVRDFDIVFLIWALKGLFPRTTRFLTSLPSQGMKDFFKADDRLYQYGYDSLDEYIKRYGGVTTRRDLLTKMIGKTENDPEALPDSEIGVELSNLTLAATDTTGTLLSVLFYELAKKPTLQTTLRDEVKGASVVDGVPIHKDLAHLPWLNASIKEALRHYPPVPPGLQRITPKEGKAIGELYVPGQTTVSSNTYTIHHNPTHFPDPYTFNPSRWFPPGTETPTTSTTTTGTPEMQRLYMPFSKGSRDCMGQTMGLFEARIVTASLLRKYEVFLDERCTEDAMSMTDHFVFIPKSGQVWLKFVPLDVGV